MFSKLQRLFNWLLQQFQLKPSQPAIAASVQALVSVLGPLGVGVLMGSPVASAIAILGAWFVGLVNVEGAYRQKATAKIVAAIGITAMLLLANLVHSTLWLSTLTTFVVMFMAGLLGLFGQAASAISLILSITFVVALARFAAFPNWSTVLEQCAFCLAGGIWSILVSLSLWVLRPYAPVIQSTAKCYSALSQLVQSASEPAIHLGDRPAQTTRFSQAQDNFTQVLMAARQLWASVWTVQRAANVQGNQLLILIEDAPQIANSVVALVEQLSISANYGLFQALQREVQQGLEELAASLQRMSEAIANGRSSVHLEALDRAIEALEHQQQTLRRHLSDRPAAIQPQNYAELFNLRQTITLFKRLTEQIHSEVELIAALQRGEALKTTNPTLNKAATVDTQPTLSAMLELLRDNLTFRSVLFRHGLRLAIVATSAELLASLFQIPRGYWITLTAVVALKPNYGGTSEATLQRVLGTVLGGVIGVAIVTLIHNSWVIGGCLLLLIVVAVAIRPLSFTLFTTLLTPAIILLLNVTNQGGWQVGAMRIIDSLAGGLLALLGSYLLFPQWERQQLPTQLEVTIRANLAYFQQVMAMYLHPEQIPTDAIAPLRRQAALENSNAAATAQRLFSEPRHVQGDVEPITSLIFYIRRFFNSITTLAEHHQELSGNYQCPDFKQFADAIVQVLENVVNALQPEQALQPLPDLDRYLDAIHDHIEQLHADRVSELATAPDTLTETLRAVRERTPISTGLDQIAHEVKNIHSAIAQISSKHQL